MVTCAGFTMLIGAGLSREEKRRGNGELYCVERERERKGGKIKRLVLNRTRKGIFVHSFSAPAEQVIFSPSHRNNGPWA